MRTEREVWDDIWAAFEAATEPLVCPRDQHTLGCQCSCPVCAARQAALIPLYAELAELERAQ